LIWQMPMGHDTAVTIGRAYIRIRDKHGRATGSGEWSSLAAASLPDGQVTKRRDLEPVPAPQAAAPELQSPRAPASASGTFSRRPAMSDKNTEPCHWRPWVEKASPSGGRQRALSRTRTLRGRSGRRTTDDGRHAPEERVHLSGGEREGRSAMARPLRSVCSGCHCAHRMLHATCYGGCRREKEREGEKAVVLCVAVAGFGEPCGTHSSRFRQPKRTRPSPLKPLRLMSPHRA
jgi:hypothetical protein